MVDTLDIKENLFRLGLDETEVEAYLAMLQDDEISVLELSKEINIPRSTVYRVCDGLVQKNFARWVISERGKNIKAVRPDELDFLVSDKKQEFEQVKDALGDLQKMVGDMTGKLPKTQVRYYQGREGIKQAIWNTLQAQGEVFGYSQFGRKDITGDTFYNRYVEEFKKRGIRDRAIGNENALKYVRGYVLNAKHQLTLSDIRIIPKKIFYVSGDNSIYNNIYTVAYWSGKEVVAVEIENEELVKLQKSIFEILWKIAKPAEEYV